MAIACLRLFTLPPFPALPERKVPCFLRRMALATVFSAVFPYLREDFFRAGMLNLLKVESVLESADFFPLSFARFLVVFVFFSEPLRIFAFSQIAGSALGSEIFAISSGAWSITSVNMCLSFVV